MGEKLNKLLISLTFLLVILFSASVSAWHVSVSNDGFNLYLSKHTPTPYNDIYYWDSYTVGPNYYGYYPSYYAGSNYALYGNYAYWYAGYNGFVSPVYGYYSFAPLHQYQYYIYQPTPLYCDAYWCYS